MNTIGPVVWCWLTIIITDFPLFSFSWLDDCLEFRNLFLELQVRFYVMGLRSVFPEFPTSKNRNKWNFAPGSVNSCCKLPVMVHFQNFQFFYSQDSELFIKKGFWRIHEVIVFETLQILCLLITQFAQISYALSLNTRPTSPR